MRCNNCYLLPFCATAIARGNCPKKDKGPKCRKCGRPQKDKFCVECYAKKAGNIMKVIDRRKKEVEKTLTLGEVPYGQAFEFIDERKPYHCSTFVKMTVAHTYRRRFNDDNNQTWAYDLVRGKLCQFSNSNEVRLLEVEFHIIGELNG